MQITNIKIEELKLAEYNPRFISDSQFEKLRRSIREFGFVEPVVVNSYPGRENVIVGGHMRVLAAKEEGMAEVPCFVVNIDPNKEKLLNLSLNRIHGEWDESKLAELIFHLNEDHADITLSGFEMPELHNLLDEGVLKSQKKDDDDFDADEEYGNIKVAESKLGEVYELGPHRLMCGDSRNPAHVASLMNGEKARLIWTDPPYNVNYKYNVSYDSDAHGKKITHGKDQKIFNDNMSDADFEAFLSDTFKNYMEHSTDDCSIYVCHATKTSEQFRNAMVKAGWYISQTIIWVKEQFIFALGQNYHRLYEPIFYGWKKGKKHFFDYEDLANAKDVWMLGYDDDNGKFFDIWRVKRDNRNTYEHPTQKPVALIKRALVNNSQRGDLVIDLFGGSGSTLLACDRMGRRCNTMELDPKFCDVIRKRYALSTQAQP